MKLLIPTFLMALILTQTHAHADISVPLKPKNPQEKGENKQPKKVIPLVIRRIPQLKCEIVDSLKGRWGKPDLEQFNEDLAKMKYPIATTLNISPIDNGNRYLVCVGIIKIEIPNLNFDSKASAKKETD